MPGGAAEGRAGSVLLFLSSALSSIPLPGEGQGVVLAGSLGPAPAGASLLPALKVEGVKCIPRVSVLPFPAV